MRILVINSGSSSVKFSMFERRGEGLASLYEGEVSGIGGPAAVLEFTDAAGRDLAAGMGAVAAGTMEEAIALVERAVGLPGLPAVEAVGYRVVHPGATMRGHQRVTGEVMRELRAAVEFAPLHDPSAIEIIEEMMRRLPGVPHVACFDTVFHETMPEVAYTYAIPRALRERGVRRYGFHGLSCESVVWQMRGAAGAGLAGALPKSMLIAHLGSGCSVTAVVDGRSAENTMGLTPTGGVVMGTRPGDLDPGLVLYLLRQPGATVDSVEAMLNHDAGLKALGGTNDMRALRSAGPEGERPAGAGPGLALEIFTRTLVKTMAGMAAVHAPAAVVFTGGIGEHDAVTRRDVAAGLWAFGAELDKTANAVSGKGLRRIGAEGARVAMYVVPAEEDLMIARHVERMCGAG